MEAILPQITWQGQSADLGMPSLKLLPAAVDGGKSVAPASGWKAEVMSDQYQLVEFAQMDFLKPELHRRQRGCDQKRRCQEALRERKERLR